MTESSHHPDVTRMTTLLTCYGFEVEAESMEQWVQQWLSDYSVVWVRLAIIEALYQGRYKAISVEQILTAWQRRGEPICHFDGEFERIVSRSIPRNLLSDESPEAVPTVDRWVTGDLDLRQRLQQLRPAPKPRPPAQSTSNLSDSTIAPSPSPSKSVDPPRSSSPAEPSHPATERTSGSDPSLEQASDAETNDTETNGAAPSAAIETINPGDEQAIASPTPTNSAPAPSVSNSPPDAPEEPEPTDAAHHDSEDTDHSPTPSSLAPSESIPAESPRAIAPPPEFGAFVPIHSMHSIQQFTPSTRNTGFYARLRAVAAGSSQL